MLRIVVRTGLFSTKTLVFEHAYNEGTSYTASTNTWVTDVVGRSAKMWMTSPAAGQDAPYRTLGAIIDGTTGDTRYNGIGPTTPIIGIEFGIGSGWQNGAASGVFHGAVDNVILKMNDGEVLNANFEPLSASVQCIPTPLVDSAAQVATCTVTVDGAAPAGGLSVALTPPAANPRYSSTCASPLVIAAGATEATCTITATDNTTPGDGDVTATVTLLAGTGYELGPDFTDTVTVHDDDVAPTVTAVPTLGPWGLLLTALGLGAVAWRRRRTG